MGASHCWPRLGLAIGVVVGIDIGSKLGVFVGDDACAIVL